MEVVSSGKVGYNEQRNSIRAFARRRTAVSTLPTGRKSHGNGYPTSDGKPMAETDWHRDLMVRLIETLKRHFATEPLVYVSGNLLLFYEEGNRRQHLSPDVFVVRGVPNHNRLNYLLWEEGRSPEVVFELTSSSTRREDQTTKRALYQDTLRVREYFLFDPFGDYLDPRLQGYRLRGGVYHPIRLVEGRLASRSLGLHLEPRGPDLRLYNPHAGGILLSTEELRAREQERAEEADQRAIEEHRRAEEERQRADRAEQEAARLRQELESLRRRRRHREG
jgi:Uma2 family endonuclease